MPDRLATKIGHSTAIFWVGIVMMVLGLAMFTGTVYVAVAQNRTEIHQNTEAIVYSCQQINKVKGAIRAVLKRSNRSIDDNPYFRDRPAELRRAHAQNRFFIARFVDDNCDDLPN